MEQTPHGRFICERCGLRFTWAGDCTAHPEEPLQDLADEDVRLMLDDFDAARRRKRLGLLGIGGLALSSPLLILIPFRQLAFFLWFAAGSALAGGIYRFFPARKVLPAVDQERPDWL